MDRTNKKSIKDSKPQSWDEYKEIFNQSPIGIIFHDEKGITVNANNSALKIMGISRLDDILGLSMFDNPPIEEKKEELINDGVIHFQAPLDLDMIKNLGFYTPTKNGVLFLDYTVSVTDSGYLVQIQDITEHQKTEEKLMQKHDVLETVLESSEGPIFSVDCNYRYTSFNLQHAKVMKNLFDADIEIGGNLLDYHTNPENRENAKLNIDKAFNGEVVNIEACAGDEGHNFRYFSIFHTPVRDSNGKVTGAAVYAHDLTERKKAEKALKDSETRFRSLYENSFDAILLTKPDGSILAANPAAQKMFDMTEEEVIKAGRAGLVVKDEILENAIKERNEKGKAEAELTFKRKDGSTFPGEATSSLFTDADGVVKTSMIIRDITERKKMEDELRESRDNLELIVQERTRKIKYQADLIENVNDAIIATDSEFNITSWNKTAEKIYGWKSEEVIGKNTSSILQIDYPDVDREEMIQSILEKGSFKGETIQKRKDGTSIPIESTVVQMKDTENNIIGYVAVNRDISKRKKAEKLLKESEEKFAKAFHSNPAAMTLGDAEGRWIDVNESFSKLTGYSKDEAIGHTSAELNIINTEEREHYINELQEKGARRDLELEIQTKSGEKRIVFSSSELIELNSEFRFITFVYDITELKRAEMELRESEEKFSTAFYSNSAAMVISNLDGEMIELNEAYANLTGYDGDELIGHKNTDFNILTIKQREELLKKLIDEGSIRNEEVEIQTKTGEKRIALYNFEFIEFGGEKRIFSIGYNITERKKAEIQLNEALNELKRSNNELQQFAYVSSHDLQEPLRTIASFTQLLQRRYEGQLDSDADEFMDYIVEAAVRMKQQIQDLLDYSRVGTQGEKFELVNTNDILNQTIKSLHTAIYESAAEITYDEPPNVMGDAGQLEKIFHNLISNAIKFRKPEEPLKIHISAYKSEDKKEYVFSIQDNGIGIEEQYFERIFTIFQRLHTRDVYKGTGIGLSIVKRIIGRHGGRVWVESALGEGSTFYFTIPVELVEN